jgi:uncharacterized alkaline shock family protein YloU
MSSLSDEIFGEPEPDPKPGTEQPQPPRAAAPTQKPAGPPLPPPAETPVAAPVEKPTGPPARIGQNELGRVEVSSRAVEKIAALATLEVEDAGGATGRGLGRQGRRRTGLNRMPKVSADVEGGHVFLDVELSVRWPMSVAQVSDAVRDRLTAHVSTLAGLEVSEVNIEVVDLVTEASAARVL